MRPENEEFIALVKAAGWSPAEAARRLALGRSSTSRFMTGEIAPSPPVLKLLRLLLANEQPGALRAAHELQAESLAQWEREVIEELRWLLPEDRTRAINGLRAFTAGLPRRQPVASPHPAPPPSSEPERAKAASLKAAADALHKRGGGRAP